MTLLWAGEAGSRLTESYQDNLQGEELPYLVHVELANIITGQKQGMGMGLVPFNSTR